MTAGLKGWMPVAQNAASIVSFVNDLRNAVPNMNVNSCFGILDPWLSY